MDCWTYSMFCFNLRPKSSRYCQQPLLNNLSASLAMSIIASGTFHKAVCNCTHTKCINSNSSTLDPNVWNCPNRFFSVAYCARASSRELQGCLPCLWPAFIWPRIVHHHPDADSHLLCKPSQSMLSKHPSIFSGCKPKCV